MVVFVKGTCSKSRAERKPNVWDAYGTLGFSHCFKPRYETICLCSIPLKIIHSILSHFHRSKPPKTHLNCQVREMNAAR